MATTEQILNINEVAAKYGVSTHLVRQYIDAGTLRAWQDGRSGRGHSWHIPASAADRVLSVYRDALTTDKAAEIAGVTPGGITQAIGSGALARIPAPVGVGVKAVRVYVARAELEAWMKRRPAVRAAVKAAEQAAKAPSTNGTHAPEPTPIQMPLTPAPAPVPVAAPDPALAAEVKALRLEVAALAVNVKAQADALTSLAITADKGSGRFTEQVAAMARAIDGLATWVGLIADPSAAKIDPDKATSLNRTARPA